MSVRIEHTNPQQADVILLPSRHDDKCPVCGGQRVVLVGVVRSWAGNTWTAWRSALTAPCPLRLGSDDLRSLLPRDTGGQT